MKKQMNPISRRYEKRDHNAPTTLFSPPGGEKRKEGESNPRIRFGKIRAISGLIALMLIAGLCVPELGFAQSIAPTNRPTVTVLSDQMKILRGRDYLFHLLDNIEQAQDRIWIATYSITGTRSNRMTYVYDRLQDRHDSGVDVRLLLPPELDRNKRVFQQLIQDYTFDVRLYQGSGQFHGKMIVIDDEHVYNGSANLTLTAMNREYETSIYINNSTLTKEFAEYVIQQWEVRRQAK